jgi:hypothetical protein
MLFLRKTILSAMLLLILPASSQAGEVWWKECKAVQNMARLDYDSKLMVGLYEEIDSKTCYFAVSLPVTSSQAPANQALAFVWDIQQNPSYVEDAIRKGAGGVMLEALLAPMKLKELQSTAGIEAAEAIRFRSLDFDKCLTLLASETAYRDIDPDLACGVSQDRKAFAVSARSKTAHFSLQLPLQ